MFRIQYSQLVQALIGTGVPPGAADVLARVLAGCGPLWRDTEGEGVRIFGAARDDASEEHAILSVEQTNEDSAARALNVVGPAYFTGQVSVSPDSPLMRGPVRTGVIGACSWFRGVPHPFVVLQDGTRVWLPRSSVGDPNLRPGGVITYSRDSYGEHYAVAPYMDAPIGAVWIWPDSEPDPDGWESLGQTLVISGVTYRYIRRANNACVYSGYGAMLLPALAMSGAGEHPIVYSGSGAMLLPALAMSGAGAHSIVYSGSGAMALPALAMSGAGSYTDVGGTSYIALYTLSANIRSDARPPGVTSTTGIFPNAAKVRLLGDIVNIVDNMSPGSPLRFALANSISPPLATNHVNPSIAEVDFSGYARRNATRTAPALQNNAAYSTYSHAVQFAHDGGPTSDTANHFLIGAGSNDLSEYWWVAANIDPVVFDDATDTLSIEFELRLDDDANPSGTTPSIYLRCGAFTFSADQIAGYLLQSPSRIADAPVRLARIMPALSPSITAGDITEVNVPEYWPGNLDMPPEIQESLCGYRYDYPVTFDASSWSGTSDVQGIYSVDADGTLLWAVRFNTTVTFGPGNIETWRGIVSIAFKGTQPS